MQISLGSQTWGKSLTPGREVAFWLSFFREWRLFAYPAFVGTTFTVKVLSEVGQCREGDACIVDDVTGHPMRID